MPASLPPRPSLEWLKKAAKERLEALRAGDPEAKLSDAQGAVAREYGYASWRRLKAHVEQVQTAWAAVGETASSAAASSSVAADDPELAKVLAAAADGDFQTVLSVVSRRRELANARGPDGETPLHAGVPSNEPRVALVLLSLGADPNATYGASGHTALSWATTYGSLGFASAIVRMGHEPDLFCAAGMGLLDEVRAFFDDAGKIRPNASRTGSSRYGADGRRLPCPPSTPVEQISDALYIACRHAKEDIVRFLLARGPNLSFRAYNAGTPLHWAYFGGSRAIVELLLAAGADPTLRDHVLRCTPRAFGICTPAHWGILEDVKSRLSDDPSLATFMDGSTSALHAAARGGHEEIVRVLLEAGASPWLLDGDGKTAAEVAAANGHPAVAALF